MVEMLAPAVFLLNNVPSPGGCIHFIYEPLRICALCFPLLVVVVITTFWTEPHSAYWLKHYYGVVLDWLVRPPEGFSTAGTCSSGFGAAPALSEMSECSRLPFPPMKIETRVQLGSSNPPDFSIWVPMWDIWLVGLVPTGILPEKYFPDLKKSSKCLK